MTRIIEPKKAEVVFCEANMVIDYASGYSPCNEPANPKTVEVGLMPQCDTCYERASGMTVDATL